MGWCTFSKLAVALDLECHNSHKNGSLMQGLEEKETRIVREVDEERGELAGNAS